MVETCAKAIGENITAKVATKIPAATQIFSIPIDLRIIKELSADFAQILVSVNLLILLPSQCQLTGLHSHEILVADWREFCIPADLCTKTHPELLCHFTGNRDLVFIVSEHDKLPCELWELRLMFALEIIEPLNVSNDPIEISPDTVDPIRLRTSTIDRANNMSY